MPEVTTPLGDVEAVPYPGRVVRIGHTNKTLVKVIQARLNAIGCGPLPENGVFGSRTANAVKLFQARFPDVTGRPLVIDGELGSLSWGALFGAPTVPSSTVPPSALAAEAIGVALGQVGVMEDPLGSNRGPQIDEYLRGAGLNPAKGSFAWCVAFTHFCYKTAADTLGVKNPHIKTAGVLDHWNRAATKANVVRVTHAKAVANPALVTPGSLFVISTGGGFGHSGMVIEVANGRLVTVEGNTTEVTGSREGIGVYRREVRKIASINKGFIDYSAF